VHDMGPRGAAALGRRRRRLPGLCYGICYGICYGVCYGDCWVAGADSFCS
jgi:hypothetical protein